MSPAFSRNGSKHPTWTPTARSAGARLSRSPWAPSRGTPRPTRSARTTCLATKAITSPTPSRTPTATANTFQNSPSCCQAFKRQSGSLPGPTTRWCPGPTPSSSMSDYPTPRSISLPARAISAGKKNPPSTPRCSLAGGTEPMWRQEAKSTNERTRSVNMTTTNILTDMVLVESEKTATIHAPVERVDIADWLLHLPDAEYQRCAPPDHIAAGTTTTDDGRPMSINVEVIGGSLMVQHYVAEVHEPHHCRMVSLSDVQTPAGWTKIQVIWDLSVTALDSGSCRYTNQVLSHPTPAFLETLKVAGISFEDAVADRQAATDDHNRRETALYAQSLERKALVRMSDSSQIALIRKLYGARGNVNVFKSLLADDLEYDIAEGFPNGGVYRGIDTVVNDFFAFFADFDEFYAEGDEYFESGDHVIVLGRYFGLTKKGRRVQSRFAHFWTLRGGKVVRLQQTADTLLIARALEKK